MTTTHQETEKSEEPNFVKAQFEGHHDSDTRHYSTWAIIGFIVTFVSPLIGLIISYIVVKNINPKKEKGKEFALAGVIIGCAVLVFAILSVTFDPTLIKNFQKRY